MKVEVLKKMEYKGHPIYIRRIGSLFEYLVIYKNELYSHYFDIKGNWKGSYSQKQLHDIFKLILATAYKCIDDLLKIKK